MHLLLHRLNGEDVFPSVNDSSMFYHREIRH